MDPHKRSATIEVMTAEEKVEGGGRFGTDGDGYAAMLSYGRQWPDRVWAVEGCTGIGKHIANRLLADAEEIIDVPPKPSARTRVFATGQGRKTDATDAHSVALVVTRMTGLRPVVNEQLAVLRILVDRPPVAGGGPHPDGLSAPPASPRLRRTLNSSVIVPSSETRTLLRWRSACTMPVSARPVMVRCATRWGRGYGRRRPS
jgi:hypothetical protein